MPSASVYQTLEWLSVFTATGSDLVFVELDTDVLVPFVCKGKGPFRRAYSLPYDTYGGPVAVTTAPVVFDNIVRALGAPSARVVDFVGNVELNGGRGEARDIATYIVDLEDGYEAVKKRYADTNQRLIRQSQERDVRITTMDESMLPVFHKLHQRTMIRYRSTAFSLDFFRALYRFMVPTGLANFQLAWHGDDVIAANLVLRYGRSAYDWLWSFDERFAHLRPTNALIDRAIHDEIQRGARQFNMGASPDERQGSVRFKKSYGAEAHAYRIFVRFSPVHRAARSLKDSAGQAARNARAVVNRRGK